MNVYVALLHYPVIDRAKDIVTTAVTNLDVHDIARTVRTYDLGGYFVVTPIAAQRSLVDRILSHWKDGASGKRMPERTVALATCQVIDSLKAAQAEIEAREGKAPRIWVTGAKAPPGQEVWSHGRAARAMLSTPESGPAEPQLIIFGTGHGLAPQVVEAADGILAPIAGAGTYNHLSVRAAVAITLDRLFGEPRD